jgi:hypothetical protein
MSNKTVAGLVEETILAIIQETCDREQEDMRYASDVRDWDAANAAEERVNLCVALMDRIRSRRASSD